jgi:hypothetical protein
MYMSLFTYLSIPLETLAQTFIQVLIPAISFGRNVTFELLTESLALQSKHFKLMYFRDACSLQNRQC